MSDDSDTIVIHISDEIDIQYVCIWVPSSAETVQFRLWHLK